MSARWALGVEPVVLMLLEQGNHPFLADELDSDDEEDSETVKKGAKAKCKKTRHLQCRLARVVISQSHALLYVRCHTYCVAANEDDPEEAESLEDGKINLTKRAKLKRGSTSEFVRLIYDFVDNTNRFAESFEERCHQDARRPVEPRPVCRLNATLLRFRLSVQVLQVRVTTS